MFRAAARRIRELGASGRPFLASVVSVTNHTPFTSREPALDIAGHATSRERILNTTRYTDDVVREFIGSLEREPWFARTIVVIFGDHGFNLGEHGGTPGEINLYREGVWVPLIIAGAHPRLPRGMHRARRRACSTSPRRSPTCSASAKPIRGRATACWRPSRGARSLRQRAASSSPKRAVGRS